MDLPGAILQTFRTFVNEEFYVTLSLLGEENKQRKKHVLLVLEHTNLCQPSGAFISILYISFK